VARPHPVEARVVCPAAGHAGEGQSLSIDPGRSHFYQHVLPARGEIRSLGYLVIPDST
jgi:hypothetical protein